MVCKNCSYVNRDGVDFCRHCGISLKEKPRTVKVEVPRVKKDSKTFTEPKVSKKEIPQRNVQVVIPSMKIDDEDEYRDPRAGRNIAAWVIALGVIVIACVAAFCILIFTETQKDKPAAATLPTMTATPQPTTEPTPTPTPVPTVAPSPTEDLDSLFTVPPDSIIDAEPTE